MCVCVCVCLLVDTFYQCPAMSVFFCVFSISGLLKQLVLAMKIFCCDFFRAGVVGYVGVFVLVGLVCK